MPGFVEIDLVGHEGGNAAGEHAYTLTVTDIATGWTENRSVRNKARKWVFAALDDIARAMPFPILGVDSDNGSEFINHHLLAWCEQRQITFTRSRPGNTNDGCHVEQKNWAIVRTVVGYHRYDTAAELLLLNKIWVLQSQLTNYFYPQQKLVSKVRDGAKVTKKYDTRDHPAPPRRTPREGHRRGQGDPRRHLRRASTPPPCNARSRPSPASCSPSPPARPDRRPKRPSPHPLRAHPRMSQRIRLRAHLDVSPQFRFRDASQA